MFVCTFKHDFCSILQMSQTLYLDMVSRVHLFKGCSEDFLSQIVRF
jgi:hypothetical protein